MANNFTIEIKGLEAVAKLFQDLPKKAQTQITNEFKAIGSEWAGAAKADAPADRSRIRGSITNKASSLTLELAAQTAYAAFQEFGTKGKFKAPEEVRQYASQFKGKGDSGGVNPIVALTAWVKRKGLNAVTYNIKTRKKTFTNKEKAARSIAFLIYRKIKREGLKPQPFLFSDKNGGDRVKYFVDKLRKNIAEGLKDII